MFWGATGLTERTGELGEVRPMGAEQTNSSVVIDETLALKLYRRIEPGVNPELELLRFLSERGFEHIATLEGYAAYEGRPLETTLAIMQRFIPAHGDGWELALDTIVADPGWMPDARAAAGRGHRPPAQRARVGRRPIRTSRPRSRAARRSRCSPPRSTRRSRASSRRCRDATSWRRSRGRGEEVRDHLRALTHIGTSAR